MSQTLSILWNFALAKRNARRWRTRDALECWQDRQVQKHLARILPSSKFYERLYAKNNLSDWKNFPLVSKSELMAAFDEWNTVGLHREQAMDVALRAENSRDFSPVIGSVTVGLSSGTSGNRGLFLVTPAERHAWAGNLLAKILPGSLIARHRAALCFRANSNLYRTVSSRRFQFAFFDLLKPVSELARELQAFQPTLLVAPPAMLRLLAEQIRDGLLRVQPEKIFSVAEVLEPEERVFIEDTFGQKLHEIYQATEGFLAVTCAHGTLHLNEDLIVFQKEWIDRSQRKFIPIITDFRRATQPIIRYRLNDILTERETPCPCGSIFTALEKIEGRCDDLLWLPSTRTGNKVPVLPDFIRRAIITADDAINDYSVTLNQNRMEVALKIALDRQSLAQNSVEKNLRQLCASLNCQAPEIIFMPYSSPTLASKRRRVRVIHS